MAIDKAPIQAVKDKIYGDIGHFADVSVDGILLPDAVEQLAQVKELKIRHTGKKSELAALMKMVGSQAPVDRAEFGQAIQAVEKEITSALETAVERLEGRIAMLKLEAERIDVTLPGRRIEPGHHHPITVLRQRIEDIFVSMGYTIEDDREIETDYYNFDALNIPEGHPARESQDTFYTTDGFALRSQTSTVQIRAMERRGVPIRILAPGKVFRR
ncbi:MAG TPA: hypothetical protein PKA82_18135, partial [Pyrinomonadaceae bacterium]|nr:hypothetical protein [Pyrinomonadaceae bacterium]